MAHFAELNENNIVVQVVVVRNEDTTDSYGVEKEEIGISYLKKIFGKDKKWVQTSFNSTFRYNFASIGYSYDVENDAFISPQIYPSWSLDETFRWKPPIPSPEEGIKYLWDENTLSWVKNPDIPEDLF